MAVDNININIEDSEDSSSLKSLWFLSVSNWKWFALSFFVCMSVAITYLLVTPKIYTRSATLLIKEDRKGKSIGSNVGGDFSKLGLVQGNTDVKNEIYSIQSPDVTYEVAKRLNLNVEYKVNGTFHSDVIYGDKLPVTVEFQSLGNDDFAKVDVDITRDGKFVLSSFEKAGKKLSGELKGVAGSVAYNTPIGKIVVKKTPFFNSAYTSKTIHVNRTSIASAAGVVQGRYTAGEVEKEVSIIKLSYNDVSTSRAVDVLNTIINVYNENWIKDKNQIAISTSEFITERLAVIEKELGSVDSNISSYKTANKLTDVEAVAGMYMQQSNKTQSDLVNLNNQAYMVRYVKNYLLSKSGTPQLLPSNSGISNPGVESQISQYNTLVMQRNSILANSSEKNPLVIDLDNQLSAIRSTILASLDNELATLNTQISSAHRVGNDADSKLVASPGQAKYLLTVERQQKVKENLYLFLLQKREENELSQAFTAYNSRVISAPRGSNVPTAPVDRKILLYALAIAVAVPLSILFLREQLRTTVRGKKDIENRLTMPFLGEIPLYEGNVDKKFYEFWKKPAEKKKVIVEHGNRDIINEAFRVVRTNLEFMKDKSKGTSDVIMLTSYNPSSGKSFITLNIGVSLGIKKQKVILIDCDLRHASLSAYINSPKRGVSDYLGGRIDNYESVIQNYPGHENVDLLPVGKIPPNPTELLFEESFGKMIEELKEKYDYIILDCPPCNMMADVSIIEKHVDRTIFVMRAGLFEREMIPQLEQEYRDKKYKNLCLLLNGTYGLGGKYGYKYGYRYGYGYGYHHGYGYGYGYGYGDDKKKKKK